MKYGGVFCCWGGWAWVLHGAGVELVSLYSIKKMSIHNSLESGSALSSVTLTLLSRK